MSMWTRYCCKKIRPTNVFVHSFPGYVLIHRQNIIEGSSVGPKTANKSIRTHCEHLKLWNSCGRTAVSAMPLGMESAISDDYGRFIYVKTIMEFWKKLHWSMCILQVPLHPGFSWLSVRTVIESKSVVVLTSEVFLISLICFAPMKIYFENKNK